MSTSTEAIKNDVITTENKLVNQLNFTEEELENFKRDGFIRIKGLFTEKGIAGIRQQVEDWIATDEVNNDGTISRFTCRRDEGPLLNSVLNHAEFRHLMTQLTDRKLIFTEAQSFELSKGGVGLPWHYAYIGMGYTRPADLGYTLWTPLQAINAKQTGGGMAYVPEHIHSARYGFDLGSLLAPQYNKDPESMEEHLKLLEENHKALIPFLEKNRIEDDFEVGDSFIFNKYIWHRSAPFLSESKTRRLGLALRFVDWNSRKEAVRWKAEYDFGGGLITGQKKYVYGGGGEDRYARFTDTPHGEEIKFSKEAKLII
jgi:hypothetical protein